MQSVDAIPVELPMDGDTSDWLVMDTIDPSTHSITGPGPDTLAVVPPVTLKAGGDPNATRPRKPSPFPLRSSSTTRPSARRRPLPRRSAGARWPSRFRCKYCSGSICFTDTGLKTQLAEHLQPIVERASAELIRAITEHVGGVLRTYVAEAIEREIAQWRREH